MNNINEAILRAAHETWQQHSRMRRNRDRCKRFTYGDQWSDPATVEGAVGTLGDAARSHGREPMTNNMIRRMVKSVIGRFRYMRDELRAAGGALDPALEALRCDNRLDELDCRALEEFLISGMAVQRVSRERRPWGEGTWVDNVNPRRFFINRVSDPRGWDTQIVGMLHDWSMGETVMRFSHGDRRRAEWIRGVFANGECASGEFFTASAAGRCRVIEVWTLECCEQLRCHDRENATCFTVPVAAEGAIDRENERRRKEGEAPVVTRWTTVTRWHCRWLAPSGELLDDYDSPYSHGSHPFVFTLYPLTDGEIHSLVEDVIDQQIYVNRLITLIDHVIGTAAKGVLLFPADQKLEGMKWMDIAKLWGSPDAILPFRPRPGQPEPRQVTVTGGDLGARELLSVQMKMFEEVSGVSETLMGGTTSAAIGVENYESRVRNAVIAITDLLSTFDSFLAERDRRALSVAT